MAWLGKMVGGAVGLAVAGPMGAVLGAAFGHELDKSETHPGQKGGGLTPLEKAQAAFCVGLFSMLAKIVRADGSVTDAKIEVIEAFIKEDLQMNPESRNTAIRIFNHALKSGTPFIHLAEQFHDPFRSQPEILEMMIDILLRVSTAGKPLSGREEEMIVAASDCFFLTRETYRKIKARHVADLSRYLAVLGADEADSEEEIKRKYRKRVSDYHPDVIMAKGLPHEFVKLAHDKFIEIQEAYEKIKKEKGMV